jgi:hypothetical protein
MHIEEYLRPRETSEVYAPTIFDLSRTSDCDALAALFAAQKIQYVRDDFEEELCELFGVQNPALVYTPEFQARLAQHLDALRAQAPLWQQGRWVYFPWSSTLSHILTEDEFQMVRTARNKNLISAKEQDKFYNATVGIGGLSVGSSVAFALALQGGAKRMKLADMDRLALSNTNRILMGVDNLGVLKVAMVAKRIYEINPYAQVELFTDGLSPENIGQFFEGLDVVVDELDNLAVKYLIRTEAKKRHIPVVMGADNGDNAVVDVERYDLDPNLPYFHGRLGDTSYDALKSLDKFGIGKTITRHIGPEHVTIRMQESLLEMGKTIVSWPQLGGAALVNGAAVAYVIRKILNGQPVESNRALIVLDENLDPTFSEPGEIEKRSKASQAFAALFGL